MSTPITQDTIQHDAALFGRCVGSPAVVVAMAEEAAPFLADASERCEHPLQVGGAQIHALTVDGQTLLLVRTGIGLVNAATALTTVLERFEPSVVISAGSAGGLRADVNVGDLVVGTEYRYADADATAFGYAPGQVPGMPEAFLAHTRLVEMAASLLNQSDVTVWHAPMLSGGSFVTEHNVGATREVFPEAVSTDMESTALAQVCTTRMVPFIAVRSISDLCGPAADQQFHMEIDLVARISADAVGIVLQALKLPVVNGA